MLAHCSLLKPDTGRLPRSSRDTSPCVLQAMAVYSQRSPAVRSISAVSPDRRVEAAWSKQPVLTPSYKGAVVQDPMEFMRSRQGHPSGPGQAGQTGQVQHPRAHSPPRVTYALCADPRQGALSPIPQRISHVPTPVRSQHGHLQNVEKPSQPSQPSPQIPYSQVAFDEAMTARPGMGRRLEWHGFDVPSPMHGAGSISSIEANCHPHASPMQKYRDRRESTKSVPVEDTISPHPVKRGHSDSSLPEKEASADLQKQIVEEVNRVLENRLAAKEETEALKKELDKVRTQTVLGKGADFWMGWGQMSFECQNEHLRLLHKLYNRRLTSFPVRLFWVVKFKIWRYISFSSGKFYRLC